MLAFLPMAGLALLSPGQVQSDNSQQFILGAVVLSRLLTPPVAALIVAYLARRDGKLSAEDTLFSLFRRFAGPSVVLVLGVAVFTVASGALLVLPGIAFALATCVVLPVMVVEGVQGPRAVSRSFELTAEHRWSLLLFWSGFLVAGTAFLGAIFAVSTDHVAGLLEPLPLVQEQAFLPMVVAGGFLYGVSVVASYQVYLRLVRPD